MDVKGITNPVFWSKVGRNAKGKGSRLEIKNGCFPIGKICFGLQEFDENNRQVNYISCYLDLDKALLFAKEIELGKLKPDSSDALKPVREFPGGTSAQKADRPDHKPIYRSLSLIKGRMWILTALEGPGKQTETGGFAPDGKFERKVSVGLSDEELLTMATMMESEYQAFRTAQYLKG